MKVTKLDGRHSGHGEFKYYIQFSEPEFKDFIDLRNWCWEQWGPSCELDLWFKGGSIVPWCWMFQDYGKRIYLRTDKEYQWYSLKWQ